MWSFVYERAFLQKSEEKYPGEKIIIQKHVRPGIPFLLECKSNLQFQLVKTPLVA